MPDLMSQSRGERLIQLYQYLPRGEKNAKTLSELISQFNPTGEKVKSRSKLLEQDLLSLFNLWGEQAIGRIPNWIVGNITGKTPKYYLQSNFSLDNFDNENLFFWEMLDKFTANYLPKDIHNTLTAKLANVKSQQQKQYQYSQLGQWKNHFYTLPSLLQAPKYDDTILNILQQAIITRKRIKIRYLAKWTTQPVSRWVYPKGLVFIDNMIYLTAFYKVEESLSNSETVYLDANRNYAVIRIQSAEILQETVPSWLDNFSLEQLSQKGILEAHLTHRGKMIDLKLKINHYACQHLMERPLCDDQVIEPFDNEHLLLTAKVMNTVRLEDWLVSMSHMSEVLEPIDVREAVKHRLLEVLRYYQ